MKEHVEHDASLKQLDVPVNIRADCKLLDASGGTILRISLTSLNLLMTSAFILIWLSMI